MRGEKLAVLLHPTALPKQEGLTPCLKSSSCILGAEKEAVMLQKLFSCLVAPRSSKF